MRHRPRRRRRRSAAVRGAGGRLAVRIGSLRRWRPLAWARPCAGPGGHASWTSQASDCCLTKRFLTPDLYHQTTIDTTILAREVNKGTGLTALLDWVGIEPTQTLAVGDSEPDLAMFRVAHRCFAPAHISCGRLARFLGCEIAPQPYQRGLLHIVRSLVTPRGGRRQGPLPRWPLWKPGEDLFLDLLTVADEPRSARFRRALFHPAAFSVFRRRG